MPNRQKRPPSQILCNGMRKEQNLDIETRKRVNDLVPYWGRSFDLLVRTSLSANDSKQCLKTKKLGLA